MADLVLKDVVAGYGDSTVIDGISMTLGDSQTIALLGRNGTGKSTLINTIMGRTTFRSGAMSYAGADMVGMPRWKRPRLGLGLVPQEREIFPSLTVEENLAIARRGGAWTIERVFDLFPQLASRRANMGNQLSGGEQQMLSVGRALMGSPRLLLLDEPLEGLAPVIVDQLMAALLKLRDEEGLAMILVEQHARLALDFAQRAIVLDRGIAVYEGPCDSLAVDGERMKSLLGVGA